MGAPSSRCLLERLSRSSFPPPCPASPVHRGHGGAPSFPPPRLPTHASRTSRRALSHEVHARVRPSRASCRRGLHSGCSPSPCVIPAREPDPFSPPPIILRPAPLELSRPCAPPPVPLRSSHNQALALSQPGSPPSSPRRNTCRALPARPPSSRRERSSSGTFKGAGPLSSGLHRPSSARAVARARGLGRSPRRASRPETRLFLPSLEGGGARPCAGPGGRLLSLAAALL